MPPGSFLPPGTIQQPGAYIPAGVDGFAPIAPVTTAPVLGTGFAGGTDDGGFHGGSGSHGFDLIKAQVVVLEIQVLAVPQTLVLAGPMWILVLEAQEILVLLALVLLALVLLALVLLALVLAVPGGFGPGGFGPGGFGPGGFGPGGFGPGGFGPGGFGPGGFDPYGPDPYGGVPAENFYYEDPSMFENFGEAEGFESGSGSGGGSSATTFIGSNNVDNVDKSAESSAWRFEGYSGADVFKGGSGNDVFGEQLGVIL